MLAAQIDEEPVLAEVQSIEGYPIFDLAQLRRYTLGDEALEREILGLFKEQAIVSLANLQASNGSNDAAGWRLAAHTLKGSARGVGAFRLGYGAELAERHGGSSAGRDASIGLVAELAAETLAEIG